ncbi:MAG: right-handed parallel beta-helix repeat-containing protein [Methylotenera sp.]|nr:right-handed parallel beta-helix repeat-containing protein [Oligoflexia bacterium]
MKPSFSRDSFRFLSASLLLLNAGCGKSLTQLFALQPPSSPEVNTPPSVLPAVVPTHGLAPNWNDFVRSSDPEVTCVGTETDCIHGGELRTVFVPDQGSCADLVMIDTLEAFTWTCQLNSGAVKFQGVLKESRSLADLIERKDSVPTWKEAAVTLSRNGAVRGRTQPAHWWTNPLVALPDSTAATVTLSSPSTVYVALLSGPTRGYNVNAPKISIVIPKGITLIGTAGANYNWPSMSVNSPTSSGMLVVAKQPFVSIEGGNDWSFGELPTGDAAHPWSLDGSNLSQNLIAYKNSNYIRIRNLNLTNSAQHSLLPQGSIGMSMRRLNIHGSHFFGIYEADSKYSEYRDLNIYQAANTGLVSFRSDHTAFRNLYFFDDLHGFATGESSNSIADRITARNISSIATSMRSSHGCTYSNFDVSRSGYGLYLYGTSAGNQYRAMTFQNGTENGIVTEGSVSTTLFESILVANNGLSGSSDRDGIQEASVSTGGNIYRNITATNNLGNGLSIQSKGAVLSGILSVNNGGDGIRLAAPSTAVTSSTVMNNSGHGIEQDDATANSGAVYREVSAVNNALDGFHFTQGPSDANLDRISVGDNGQYGMYFGDTALSSSVLLSGDLFFSSNTMTACRLPAGGLTGITDTLCTPGSTSTAVIHSLPSLLANFKGPVIPSAQTGDSRQDYAALFNSPGYWSSLVQSLQAWGKDSGGRGRCLPGELCQIMDFGRN